MSPQRSVLIVDSSPESREVFRTALGRGGARVFEAEEASQGLEIARQEQLDLIVLDIEASSPTGRLASEFGETAEASSTPIVILATARRKVPPMATGEFVAKPYHYGPLIRRIEELLR